MDGREMIKRKLEPWLSSIDSNINKMMSGKENLKEEDVIKLLSEMKAVTEAINVLYRNLSKGLLKFIDKN
jgi:hypothetical protein